MKTDALDHWESISEQHNTILEFIQWLQYEKNIELDWSKSTAPLFTTTGLVDEFLEVDRRQLENQRTGLLREQRKLNVNAGK